MKTRKPLIVILVVALLVVYYLLGTDYLEQRRENKALAPRIDGATRILAEIPLPPADPESQLSNARTGLEEAKNAFPERLNSTRIINTILRLADDVGVKAIPLLTQPWTTESVNTESYSVFRLHVAVTGTFTELSSFLSRLETGELDTLVMEYMIVESTSAPFRGEGVYGSTIQVDAGLEIAIYSQPPVTEIDGEDEL